MCPITCFAFGRLYIGRKPLVISILSSVSHAVADEGDSFTIARELSHGT